MALELGVSSSYLLGVEHGRKKPSIEWLDTICNKYNIGGDDKEHLNKLILEQIEVVESGIKTTEYEMSSIDNKVEVSLQRFLQK